MKQNPRLSEKFTEELEVLISRLDEINKKRKITPWWRVIERIKIYNERQKLEKALDECKVRLMQRMLGRII